jgi:non-specific serine/threonine protein kinase
VPPLVVAVSSRPLSHAEDEAQSPAVRLFVARAQAASPMFALTDTNAATVAAICARLDGLPLAIELAAARIPVLAPAALLARLERALPLLTSGARDRPDRQRTMRDAIAWSHDLLDPGEQVLFRRLAVFVGGFDLEGAEAVGGEAARRQGGEGEGDQRGLGNEALYRGDPPPALPVTVLDGVASLIEKSLVREVGGPLDEEPRYRMLETVREFGLEQLAESGEADEVRDRHAAWCLALAERSPVWPSPVNPVIVAKLEAEHPNLRAALAWLEEAGPGRGDDLLRLAAALGQFWFVAGREREELGWLERALAAAPATPTPVRSQALFWAGFLAHEVGEPRAALYAEQALAVARALGDTSHEARALALLGGLARAQGDWAAAEEAFTASKRLHGAGTHPWLRSMNDFHLGVVALGRGEPARAAALLEEARAAAEAIGDEFIPAWSLQYLALLACEQGDLRRAAEHLRRLPSRAWEPGWRDYRLSPLAAAAVLASAVGAAEATARLFGAATAGHPDSVPHLPERTFQERAAAAARLRLGDAAYAAAWEAGYRLRPAEVQAEVERVLAADEGTPPAGRAAKDPMGLTEREVEVLGLLVEGLTDREIAEALSISPRTASGHVANVLDKLGLDSRTAAATYAVRHGLV